MPRVVNCSECGQPFIEPPDCAQPPLCIDCVANIAGSAGDAITRDENRKKRIAKKRTAEVAEGVGSDGPTWAGVSVILAGIVLFIGLCFCGWIARPILFHDSREPLSVADIILFLATSVVAGLIVFAGVLLPGIYETCCEIYRSRRLLAELLRQSKTP